MAVLTRGVRAFAVAAILPVAAQAGVAEFVPFAAVTAVHDSNVYRFADATEAQAQRGSRELADRYLKYGVGINARYDAGIQDLTGTARADRWSYSEFSELGRDEHDVSLRYRYGVDRSWTGTLGLRQAKVIEPFTSRDSFQAGFVNLLDVNAASTLTFLGRWKLGLSFEERRRDFTAAASQASDRSETGTGIEFGYAGQPRATLAVGIDHTRGDYRNRPAGGLLAHEFRQTDSQLRASYQLGGSTQLRAALGNTRRENAGGANTAFSGGTGRLGVERRGTGSNRVGAELFRRVQSVEEPDADHVVQTGYGAFLRYGLTRFIGANVRLEGYDGRFGGSGGTGAAGAPREDRVSSATAGILYAVRGNVSLAPEFRYERRDSNLGSRAYRSVAAMVTLEVRYD